ncbi:MAG: macro domain-containing protein [Candidatus Thermoplasmatota archaeon]|nr:macro domain-containing protein [Candidatus Thermoplasmatota archaeon]
MVILIQNKDLTQVRCDGIVNPANSSGYMGGGVAGAIKRAGGSIIEKQAVMQAPIPVGGAVITTGGNLPCNFVIHAPTMERPAMHIGLENVKVATIAALKIASNKKLKSIAIPGMGTGVGGVDKKAAAKAMMSIVKEFEDKFEKIILVDRNQIFIDALKQFL